MPLALPPLSAYVHVPWCVRKCPYCDFNSHQAGSGKAEDPLRLPEEDYLLAIAEDLAGELKQVRGRKLQSVFFGGGTPSLLQPVLIENILDLLSHHIGFAEDCEITLEANPGTFEAEKFAGYCAAGINRLSIGIQSFDDLKLQALGRIHGSDEARRAVTVARDAGFTNINLDLMFGLPGQTPAESARDLQQAIDLNPQHISWYELTLEPNTEFYKRPPRLPTESVIERINETGFELLKRAGYRRYETSAFAKPGYESRHNLNYWQFGDYLALGPGAHGKTTHPDGTIHRYSKTRLPKDYLVEGGARPISKQQIPQQELAFEYLMNALRLIDGFALGEMQSRTGLDRESIHTLLQPLAKKNYLEISQNSNVCPTSLGIKYLNDCLIELLPT